MPCRRDRCWAKSWNKRTRWQKEQSNREMAMMNRVKLPSNGSKGEFTFFFVVWLFQLTAWMMTWWETANPTVQDARFGHLVKEKTIAPRFSCMSLLTCGLWFDCVQLQEAWCTRRTRTVLDAAVCNRDASQSIDSNGPWSTRGNDDRTCWWG